MLQGLAPIKVTAICELLALDHSNVKVRMTALMMAACPSGLTFLPLLMVGDCQLQEAVDLADSPGTAAKWAGQIEVLQRRRAPLQVRWQSAFDALHVELKALKAAITTFRAASAAGTATASASLALPVHMQLT